MNVIAAYVLDRHNLERKDRKAGSRMRYKAFLEDNRRDSASDSDADPLMQKDESPWIKVYVAYLYTCIVGV
jgi:hypothetical protein